MPPIELDTSGQGSSLSGFEQYHGAEMPEMECNIEGHSHMAKTIESEDHTFLYMCPTTGQQLIQHEQ